MCVPRNIYYALAILLIAFILPSCSTPMEKKVKRYAKDGVVVLHTQEVSLYAYDNKGLFAENIEKKSKQYYIEFNREYHAHVYHSYFRMGQTEYNVRGNTQTRTISPSKYSFSIMKDIGILAIGRSNETSGVELLFLFKNPTFCYEVNSCVTSIHNGEPVVKFYVKGSLWYYGTTWGNRNGPQIPEGSLDKRWLEYWKDNSNRLPSELFEYTAQIVFSASGQIISCDRYVFPYIHKTYTLDEMLHGEMFVDINPEMIRIASAQFEEDARTNSVSIPTMANFFSTYRSKTEIEQQYPSNTRMIIEAKFNEIYGSEKEQYMYKFSQFVCKTQEPNKEHYLRVYSNDERFGDLDYPCTLYFEATYSGVHIDTHIFFPDEYYYTFTDAKFLFVK